MSDLEKTMKLRAYDEEGVDFDVQADHKHDQALSYELATKNAQLAEEKSRSLENLKTIVQLRENHKQEQAKVAEMAKKIAELEDKINNLAGAETGELSRMSFQLEEEKRKTLEQANTIEQQRKNISLEQSRVKELEAKVKDLTDRLDQISSLAASAKSD